MTDEAPTDGSGSGIERRRFLRASTAAATGLGATAALTGTATAGDKKCGSDDPDEPDWYPWYDIENWTDHGVPWDAGEITFYVNGWQADFDRATNQGYETRLALERNGYGGEAVGALWDSVTASWSGGEDKADEMGYNLAQLIAWMQDENGTDVRLVGHSLGARVVGTCLNHLNDWGRWIPAAVFLGGAVENDSVAWGEEFYYGIRDAAGQFDNYHSQDDAVLEDLYTLAEWDKAVGETGADGWPPDDYTDHDVTSRVGSDHCAYYKRGDGCVDLVVDDW